MNKSSRIYIAGHNGLVGSAIVRHLKKNSFKNLITINSSDLDLTRQAEVEGFFEKYKPEYVFMAAALVGGIWANKTRKAEFIFNNLSIQNNVIDTAHKSKVKKLLFLGSSCIYPKLCPQPIKEEYILSGPLEETNDAYAVAKIAGIKMCQSYREQYGCDFISILPTNLYGPNDNFDSTSSHLFPAMIRRMHEAKVDDSPTTTCWGDGSAKREFMHVDDMAAASVHLMNTYSSQDIVNVGTGEDISIYDFAILVAKVVGYKGKILWDTSKPNGTPRKLLDVSRLHATGFKHSISLTEGIKSTYDWYISTYVK